MALASALVSLPGATASAGRKGLAGFFGVVRVNPVAAVSAVPAATFVIPRNQDPCHWPGRMEVLAGPRVDRIPPWNYKERPINKFWALFDYTTDRMDEYSRIIVVDGNIGAGKTTVAKTIAKAFDMLYLPEPDSRMLYNHDPPLNFDLRDPVVQAKLHPRNRKYDLEDFYDDPHKKPGRAAELQIMFYKLRYYQYAEACLHLLSTGQGVVLDRSIFSDHVFEETLRDHGIMSKRTHNWYHYLRTNTICNFWKPHLTVYLDCPVELCMERIKKRGIASECNSKILNEDYLTSMENHYKSSFLPEMGKYGELIVMEYPDYEDDDTILEEITRVDFSYEIDDPLKFKGWRKSTDAQVMRYRQECADDYYKEKILDPKGRWRVPELWKDGQLELEVENVAKAVSDPNIAYGYKECDDKWRIMFRPGVGGGNSKRKAFKFLDNVPTPILGPEYAEVRTANNPMAGAALEIA